MGLDLGGVRVDEGEGNLIACVWGEEEGEEVRRGGEEGR